MQDPKPMEYKIVSGDDFRVLKKRQCDYFLVTDCRIWLFSVYSQLILSLLRTLSASQLKAEHSHKIIIWSVQLAEIFKMSVSHFVKR